MFSALLYNQSISAACILYCINIQDYSYKIHCQAKSTHLPYLEIYFIVLCRDNFEAKVAYNSIFNNKKLFGFVVSIIDFRVCSSHYNPVMNIYVSQSGKLKVLFAGIINHCGYSGLLFYSIFSVTSFKFAVQNIRIF